jgi:hypothetical protein
VGLRSCKWCENPLPDSMRRGSKFCCAACRSASKSKTFRERNPEYQKVLRTRRMYWISKIKISLGCSVCGYNDSPVALDFDHLDRETKLFNVSAGNVNRSLQNFFNELRKCRVICANCHRIHSYENGHFANF